jgi:diadenosine tetraphosphatase ApaH/serine/threonine PP2A family protein phosphatase
MIISDMLVPDQGNPIRAERYAILGDIHANLEALMAVLCDAREQHCSHFACVGDVVGYNANPKECLGIVRDFGMPCVKGNHDDYASTDRFPDGFNPRAAASILWTRQQLSEQDKNWLRDLKFIRLVGNFSIVHATLDGPQRWGYIFDKWAAAASFGYQNTAICFFGHTHVPLAFTRDATVQGGPFTRLKAEPGRKYLVNVGSVGEPRDSNSLAAYVLYDALNGDIELRRVSYDCEATEAKVRQAGLPLRRKPGAAK